MARLGKFFIIFILVVFVAIGGYFGIKYFSSKWQEAKENKIIEENGGIVEYSKKIVQDQGENKLSVPKELGDGFDPSQNAPKFRIVKANNADKTVKLQVVWPKSWEDREFVSKIECKPWDINLVTYENGKSSEKLITIDKLWEYMSNESEDPKLFSGKCSDANCGVINSECKLNL